MYGAMVRPPRPLEAVAAREAIEGCDDRGHVGKFGTPRTAHECCPSDLLLRVVSKLVGQRETFGRSLDTSARKRCRDLDHYLSSVHSRNLLEFIRSAYMVNAKRGSQRSSFTRARNSRPFWLATRMPVHTIGLKEGTQPDGVSARRITTPRAELRR